VKIFLISETNEWGLRVIKPQTPARFVHICFLESALRGVVMDTQNVGPEVAEEIPLSLADLSPETELPDNGNTAAILKVWRDWLRAISCN
jgi:hypothetical protein